MRTSTEGIQLHDREAIDRIADQFEANFRNGDRQKVEEFIAAHAGLREHLLRELIAIEVELRFVRGERPTLEEYLARFPNDRKLVTELDFAGIGPNSATISSSNPFPDSMTKSLFAPNVANKLDPVPTLQAKAPQISGYEMLGILGQGGMGRVYKAREIKGNRLVAVKVIRSLDETSIDALARFRIEAEAVACLRHDNIVPVLEIGVTRGVPFIVMPYESGGNLKKAIKDHKEQYVWTSRLAAGIARGLSHSHRLGILHRDLKPQNVLLTPGGVPRIADFGLAKFMISGASRERLWEASISPGIQGSLMELHDFSENADLKTNSSERARQCMAEYDPRLTETLSQQSVAQFITDAVAGFQLPNPKPWQTELTRQGDLLGTPTYMAPEQVAGDHSECGPFTDIYALGVIMYEMLTGQPPFRSDSFSKLFQQIRLEEPAPLLKKIPKALRSICAKCLQKVPTKRFSNAGEIAELLDDFVTNEAKTDKRKWWQLLTKS